MPSNPPSITSSLSIPLHPIPRPLSPPAVVMTGHGGSPTTRSPEQHPAKNQMNNNSKSNNNNNSSGKSIDGQGQGLAPGPGQPHEKRVPGAGLLQPTAHHPTTTVSSAQHRDHHHRHPDGAGGSTGDASQEGKGKPLSPRSFTPTNSPDLGSRGHRDILPPRYD